MLALSDVRYMIPMHGMVQSLNVSVAAAITLYHVTTSAPLRHTHTHEPESDLIKVFIIIYVNCIHNIDAPYRLFWVLKVKQLL